MVALPQSQLHDAPSPACPPSCHELSLAPRCYRRALAGRLPCPIALARRRPRRRASWMNPGALDGKARRFSCCRDDLVPKSSACSSATLERMPLGGLHAPRRRLAQHPRATCQVSRRLGIPAQGKRTPESASRRKVATTPSVPAPLSCPASRIAATWSPRLAEAGAR